MDLAIDSTTHDLALDAAGDLPVVDGVAAVVQQLRIRFQFFLGEWFLDARAGIPYFQQILVKSPSKALVTSILSQVIRTCPGIASLDKFDYVLDAPTRTLSFTFSATTTTGETLTSADFGAFVLEF